ncbi:MAG: hypothetical protein JNM10_14210 [Planctomycetia bacterium]|nr:hypothetical protein [Planctomycetia bacterium]
MRVSFVLSIAAAVGAVPFGGGPLGGGFLAPLSNEAVAAPESAPAAAPTGGLRGFQARLEAETVRILGAEVAGEMKARLAARGTSLWACVSVREWQRQVLAEAPSLARAVEVCVRRSEVLWREAGVTDALTDPIPQMASVHAMQRGLVRLLVQLGVPSTPPPPSLTAPRAAPAAPGARPANVAMSIAPTPLPRRGTAVPAAAPATPALSPVQLAAYADTLDRETLRILTPEVVGPVLAGLTSHRSALRAATTVKAWREALVAAHPSLAKAAAVLERRTEVLREQHGVRDAYASDATQRAAVRGLTAGLDRLLKQFGR